MFFLQEMETKKWESTLNIFGDESVFLLTWKVKVWGEWKLYLIDNRNDSDYIEKDNQACGMDNFRGLTRKNELEGDTFLDLSVPRRITLQIHRTNAPLDTNLSLLFRAVNRSRQAYRWPANWNWSAF